MMGTFERSDLEALEKLARLECPADEREEVFSSLRCVLAYVEELQQIPTEEVAPCSYVLRSMLHLALRPDQIDEPSRLSRASFLANAPDQVGGMVRVPPVLTTE